MYVYRALMGYVCVAIPFLSARLSWTRLYLRRAQFIWNYKHCMYDGPCDSSHRDQIILFIKLLFLCTAFGWYRLSVCVYVCTFSAICIAAIFAPHHIVHTFDPLLFDATFVRVFVLHMRYSRDSMLNPDTFIVIHIQLNSAPYMVLSIKHSSATQFWPEKLGTATQIIHMILDLRIELFDFPCSRGILASFWAQHGIVSATKQKCANVV